MKLRIDAIHNHGDMDTEHITMTVLEDTNLHYYLVMDTTYSSAGKVSNKFRHTKWMPSVEAKEGDRVSLWTKHGKDTTVERDGVTWHRCFWNSDAAIWNDDGEAAILFHVDAWKTTKSR